MLSNFEKLDMKSKCCCFGEVLWDVFPDKKIIGGAPLNVALRLHALGNPTEMISRIGNDESGNGILDYMRNQGLSTRFVQTDEDLATGEVTVHLDAGGSASYDIEFPRAWDNIQLSDKEIELVSNCDIFVFGSLAARNEGTYETLSKLLGYAKFKVFDVNLRKPHFDFVRMEEFLGKADFIKFNDEELHEIARHFGSNSDSLKAGLRFISNYLDCTKLCVTRGKDGAMLLYDGELFENAGYEVKVVDTVGAGDSFLATLLTFLSAENPQKALDYACAMGALVAGTAGAIEAVSMESIRKMVDGN